MTLVGIVSLTGFVIWHLMRRGRLLRERLGPPRLVDWSEGQRSSANDRESAEQGPSAS
jgi:hypothetical protein